MKANKETLSYLVTIFLSILVLWFGWLYVRDGAEFFQNTSGEAHEEFLCRVLEVTDENQKVSALGDMYYLERFIEFDAEILRGHRKGDIIPVVQTIDNVSTLGVEPVEKGDRLFVYLQSEENGEQSWYAGDYYRSGQMGLLLGFFCLALLFFGGKKGFNTILSLALLLVITGARNIKVLVVVPLVVTFIFWVVFRQLLDIYFPEPLIYYLFQ